MMKCKHTHTHNELYRENQLLAVKTFCCLSLLSFGIVACLALQCLQLTSTQLITQYTHIKERMTNNH